MQDAQANTVLQKAYNKFIRVKIDRETIVQMCFVLGYNCLVIEDDKPILFATHLHRPVLSFRIIEQLNGCRHLITIQTEYRVMNMIKSLHDTEVVTMDELLLANNVSLSLGMSLKQLQWTWSDWCMYKKNELGPDLQSLQSRVESTNLSYVTSRKTESVRCVEIIQH